MGALLRGRRRSKTDVTFLGEERCCSTVMEAIDITRFGGYSREKLGVAESQGFALKAVRARDHCRLFVFGLRSPTHEHEAASGGRG